MATSSKMQKKLKAVKEPSVEYEIGEQFTPVKDKSEALDIIFRNADIKHGLAIFARTN